LALLGHADNACGASLLILDASAVWRSLTLPRRRSYASLVASSKYLSLGCTRVLADVCEGFLSFIDVYCNCTRLMVSPLAKPWLPYHDMSRHIKTTSAPFLSPRYCTDATHAGSSSEEWKWTGT
jgi:hypothetical protein